MERSVPRVTRFYAVNKGAAPAKEFDGEWVALDAARSFAEPVTKEMKHRIKALVG